MDPSTHQTATVRLQLETCNGTITWSLDNQKPDQAGENDLSPGMRMKYTTTGKECITYLDEGFIDLRSLKIVSVF